MTYATALDLTDVIPASDLALLTDQTGPADTIDQALLVQALEDATAEINSRISKRVTLPLANPPRMLLVACRDLAVYRLYANRGRVTETQTNLRDAALNYLDMVAAGKLSLGDEVADDNLETSPGVVIHEGPERVMTRDSLKGF